MQEKKNKKIFFCWIKTVLIYFEIYIWCIILDMSSIIKLLTHFMLDVEHSALMSHLSCDSCQFYLSCNIHLFLKFLVSRISSCLNVILIIFFWLNSFLLRMFKCHVLVIIVLIYYFHVYLSTLLKSIASVCMLRDHVFFLFNFFFVQRFLIFFTLVRNWSKIKLSWKKRKNI